MRCITCNELVDPTIDPELCPACVEVSEIPEEKATYYCLEGITEGVTLPPSYDTD